MRHVMKAGGWLSLYLCVVSTDALAHHAASRDADQGEHVRWQGTISKVSWDGAHVMYQIDVADAQGQVDSWQVLGASPKRLAQRGIRQSSIAAGATVTVEGFLNPFSKQVSPMYLDTGGQRYYVGYFLPDGKFIGR